MIEQQIPKGWRFYSADFSIEDSRGRVLLVRCREQREAWHQLSEEQQEQTPLYAHGFGFSLEEAVRDAAHDAELASVIPI